MKIKDEGNKSVKDGKLEKLWTWCEEDLKKHGYYDCLETMSILRELN